MQPRISVENRHPMLTSRKPWNAVCLEVFLRSVTASNLSAVWKTENVVHSLVRHHCCLSKLHSSASAISGSILLLSYCCCKNFKSLNGASAETDEESHCGTYTSPLNLQIGSSFLLIQRNIRPEQKKYTFWQGREQGASMWHDVLHQATSSECHAVVQWTSA